MTQDTAALIATAHALADAARPATLAHFRNPALAVDSKGAGFDPVTAADREAEAAMRAILAVRRPDDAVQGEEMPDTAGTSGWTWVLDPVDGTRAFLCGAPSWGVLIALADAHGPRFGLIDQPFTGERFAGGFGVAEWRRGDAVRPLDVRGTERLSEALIMTTFPEVGTPADGQAFQRLAAQCRLTRYGLDCYAYALLALGQIDLVVEAGLKAHDIAAPIAVIEAAGGIVTDWQGGPAHGGGQALAAATPALHAAALAVLAG
ncbi:MAG: inositol monophosphatase family protein [Rhodobacteraceae bacterium]|jgi:histidinol phosphatase-like enzyme (inositol monophosphatase family)|nr:inositol monophosphatase family protein [Paracoccaceae bacterium]